MSMTRKLLIGTAILAVLVCAWIWIAGCIRAERTRIEALKEWHITSRQDWPETLLELLREAKRKHVHLGQITVLHRPYFGEYSWKCDTSAELLDLMVARWNLSRLNTHHDLTRRILERTPSESFRSNQADDVAYYVSANWIAGEKGHWYGVLNNETQKRITVLYSYNF